MKLMVNELKTELIQEVSSDSFAIVEAVRLHLYKHGNPAGSLFVEIRDGQGQLVAISEQIPIESISEMMFFHGQIRFYVSAYLRPESTYQLVLKSTGYNFTEESYVGWCLDFDFGTYPKDSIFAHDYEFWTRK